MNAYPFAPRTMPSPGPSSDTKVHWERVYAATNADEVSWYQAQPELSLSLVEATAIDRDAAVIDVGGGTSTLVEYLLDGGYRGVTVLDIAANAIQRARTRLGDRASRVIWLVSDICEGLPERQYDLWHDRAVFHFLTNEKDRDRYLTALKQALKPGGHLIIACFAANGPSRCSGLPVRRYGVESLSQTLGGQFVCEEARREAHQTPGGTIQGFIYCRFRRRQDS